uniref:hypothetical protein n=1 Tax=Gelidibacter sp. TaxID=2018083 RepID=UPI004049A6B3
MNLKTLISIKFIVYVLAVIAIFSFSYMITKSFDKIETQNEELLKQKTLYDSFLSLKNNDAIGKLELTQKITESDSKIKSNSIEDEPSLNTLIIFLLVLVTILNYTLNYLNTKIQALESEETEEEKLKFL